MLACRGSYSETLARTHVEQGAGTRLCDNTYKDGLIALDKISCALLTTLQLSPPSQQGYVRHLKVMARLQAPLGGGQIVGVPK